jgi:hypothetical protein
MRLEQSEGTSALSGHQHQIRIGTGLSARLAGDYGVLADGEWKTLSEATIDVRRMLYGLRRKVLEAARESRSITDRLATQ